MGKWLSSNWWLKQVRVLQKRHLPRASRWLKSLWLRDASLARMVFFLLMGAAASIIAAWVLPDLLNVIMRSTSPADLIRLALTIAAGVGVVVALVVAYRRDRDLEQGKFTESFLSRGYRWWSQRVRHVNLALAVVFSLVGAVALAVIAAWVLAPRLNVGNEPTPPADLTRLVLTVAAGVGGVVALVVAYRRQRDLEQGRFTESFGAAAKQLGDADVAVRLAGVYAMAGVADQSSGLKSQQCIDVLCGYLRLPYSPELGNNHQSALVVRKPVLRTGGPEEELHYQYRQNDKVVRQTIVRVITAHLQPTAPQSWTSNNFDFSDSHFETADFDGATFNGEVTLFVDATFSGKVASFDSVVFSGSRTSFHGATFSSERTWFRSVKFSSNYIDFASAIFRSERTWFAGATFTGWRTWFDNATFSSDDTKFDGATFNGKVASFDGATFNGKRTSFRTVDFGTGKVTFVDPKAWNPAPVFDWDEENDPAIRKPKNVMPQNWPPPVAKEKI